MDDPVFVRLFERLSDLSGDRQRFIQGNRPSCDPLRQVLALDELHDQRVLVRGFLEPVDRSDVWMIQRGQRLCFSLETGQAVRVRGERVRQHLDRDLAAEARVSGTVDRAHTAFADLSDDFVHPDARTRRDSQTVGLYERSEGADGLFS